MKVAIVHDYLFQFGGAEKVVEAWLDMYPQAEIYTSFFVPEKFNTSESITKAYTENRIYTSIAQCIFSFRFMHRFQKHFFWLYPLVMRLVKVQGCDIVLTSSTDCGKQIQLKNNKKIIHYCHSPTRYLHGLTTEADHNSLNTIYKIFIPLFIPFLRWLDLRAVKNLNALETVWLANSEFIKTTIKQVYLTDSTVVYPPIELDKFLNLKRTGGGDFYLCHGRISFHKRIDLAIVACLELGKKLKISGTAGFQKQMDDLVKLVTDYEKKHPEKKGLIEFLGRTSDEQYFDLINHCKGFLFPGKEDFGIAPIEILAAGVPVIAYQSGGALEYVKESLNGVFFPDQTVDSLIMGIQRFEQVTNWNTEQIRESSLPFSLAVFRQKITQFANN